MEKKSKKEEKMSTNKAYEKKAFGQHTDTEPQWKEIPAHASGAGNQNVLAILSTWPGLVGARVDSAPGGVK